MRSGLWLTIMVVALLAGCGSRYQAPVDQAGEPLFLNAGRQHLVNEGETLYVVAWMYDLDFAALARVNNLREPFALTPGQLLTVDLRSQPGGGAAVANARTTTPATSSAVVATPAQVTGISTTTRRSSLPPSEASTRPARTPLPPAGGATTPVAPPVATPPAVATSPAPATPPAVTTNEPVTAPVATANTGAVSWAWPHRGNIVGRFADSGADNKGIDIAGNEGDPVLAAADGEVVYAGSGLLRYGNLIIIKHNDRYLSAYAHNRALVVGEKERVTKGQKIAELGSSGIDRNLLHFEIRVDGKPSDPQQFLPAR